MTKRVLVIVPCCCYSCCCCIERRKEWRRERERALINLSRKVIRSIESSTNKQTLYFENTKHILIEYSFGIDSIKMCKTTSYHNYPASTTITNCEEEYKYREEEDGVSTGKSNDIERLHL